MHGTLFLIKESRPFNRYLLQWIENNVTTARFGDNCMNNVPGI